MIFHLTCVLIQTDYELAKKLQQEETQSSQPKSQLKSVRQFPTEQNLNLFIDMQYLITSSCQFLYSMIFNYIQSLTIGRNVVVLCI